MKYIIDTLGCKVNQYETQAMDAMLKERGHAPAETPESADVVIVNTCAVTAESGRKSRQALRRLMEHSPQALSVVCGCWSQIEPRAAEALGADIVRGSGDRRALVLDIEKALAQRERSVIIDKPFQRRELERLPAGAYDSHARAYLKLEDGCENFCSYCVIPYARGRVRSLPPQEAALMALDLQRQGYRELVLTGIEIASYGSDLPGSPGLADCVEAIAEAAPLLRLRLGSLEPTVLTEEFCRRIAATGRVCPHFHLSLQSGCDRTLSAMRRKYTAAEFIEYAERLRRYFPGCALTGDLIAGFPGETEDDHRESMETVRRVKFAALHVFPYSRRPGTPADKLKGQLTAAEKARRAAEVQALARELRMEYLNAQRGRVLEVLFETESGGLSTGHAENYMEVSVQGEHLRGLVKNVQISDVSGEILVGLIV